MIQFSFMPGTMVDKYTIVPLFTGGTGMIKIRRGGEITTEVLIILDKDAAQSLLEACGRLIDNYEAAEEAAGGVEPGGCVPTDLGESRDH
jgi:hypothetical protein